MVAAAAVVVELAVATPLPSPPTLLLPHRPAIRVEGTPNPAECWVFPPSFRDVNAVAAAVPAWPLGFDDEGKGVEAVDSTPRMPRRASPGWLSASPSPPSSTGGGGSDGFTGLAMWKSFTCYVKTPDGIAGVRIGNSRSRVFVATVHSCALVLGGRFGRLESSPDFLGAVSI